MKKNSPKEIDSKFLVQYKDTKYYLNEKLAKLQKLPDECIQKLVEKHVEKLIIFEQMENTDDKYELRKLAKDATNIEFDLQELWGFPMDANFHRWFDVPKCLCPRMDNLERLATPYKVIVENCPIHGTI